MLLKFVNSIYFWVNTSIQILMKLTGKVNSSIRFGRGSFKCGFKMIEKPVIDDLNF